MERLFFDIALGRCRQLERDGSPSHTIIEGVMLWLCMALERPPWAVAYFSKVIVLAAEEICNKYIIYLNEI
jgi:hypothetical protein